MILGGCSSISISTPYTTITSTTSSTSSCEIRRWLGTGSPSVDFYSEREGNERKELMMVGTYSWGHNCSEWSNSAMKTNSCGAQFLHLSYTELFTICSLTAKSAARCHLLLEHNLRTESLILNVLLISFSHLDAFGTIECLHIQLSKLPRNIMTKLLSFYKILYSVHDHLSRYTYRQTDITS